jgi:hypothetical protein
MPRPFAITAADILDTAEFARVRAARLADIRALKADRKVEVGPFVTFYFENYDTMWWQVQEMLRVEQGGDAQLEAELAAYNPMIPQGSELVATMMIEIDEQTRRLRELSRLGGIENTVRLVIGAETIAAAPEKDVERTTAQGRTSSVHFLRFPFSQSQIAAFRDPNTLVRLAIEHRHYAHAAALGPEIRQSLAKDFR